MTHQITRIELEATSIGTQRHLVVHRFGEFGRGPHVYVQASLHADEAPAMLVAHHLVRMLKSRAKDFKGSATIVPYANPIGLSQRMLALHAGRGDLGVGGNFNRRFADLSAALQSRLARHAKDRPEALQQVTRQILLELAAALPAPDELSGLRKTLLQLALEADYVLDLHTHYEGTVYMYTNVTDPDAADELGRLSQCRVVLHDQGAVAMPGQLSLDQACDLAWRAAGDFGVPHGCFTATLEYRGQTDTSDALAEADAAALVQFMIRRGVLSGTPDPLPTPLCEPTPVDAVAHLQAPRPGIIIHRVAPGAAALRAREAAGTMAREHAARLEEAIAAARLEERARIRAIVNSDAAEGREKQALMLATETALSVAEAERILGVSPKETRLEALAQRASAGPEFGAPGGTEKPDAGALIQESWKRAIANANRQFARA